MRPARTRPPRSAIRSRADAKSARRPLTVGVDGCRSGGWLAVFRSGEGLEFGVFPSLAALAVRFGDGARILIDVPIGLPWREVPVRPCDRRAREVLGRPRRSSVFAVPCRAALRCLDRLQASAVNYRELGRRVGVQTWGISRRIGEVDDFLLGRRGDRVMREVHPEVCFWALAGGRPMRYSKKTTDGVRERLEVLSGRDADMPALLERASSLARSDFRIDDVLDAAVAFLTAESPAGSLSRLSGEPPQDRCGLPMEMVHVRPG